MIPNNLILETSRVLLRPVSADDLSHFHALSQDIEMWAYFTLNLSDEKQLKQWLDAALHEMQTDTRRPFTIIDKDSGRIAGSTSIGNISYHDLRLEIGWSWLGKEFRSSGLNRHAKFAMMRYAFGEIGFERVEFKTDVLNERAKQGLRKIGGTEEGILRSHMTVWNNRRRTSVYFSVLKDEWPGVKQKLFSDIES